MIKVINEVLEEIDNYLSNENNWNTVKWDKDNKIKLEATSKFPNKQEGIYFIKTNFSNNELSEYGKTKENKHYDYEDRISKNRKKINVNFIPQVDNEGFIIVYNGENKNIRNRIQSHFNSYSGNACLAINERNTHGKTNLVVNNRWKFAYLHLSDIKKLKDLLNKTGNKEIRIILENAWRYKKGWPVLCIE